MKDILTPKEIAQYLRINKDTVYRKIRSGELKSKNIGSSKKPDYRIKKDWLEEFLIN